MSGHTSPRSPTSLGRTDSRSSIENRISTSPSSTDIPTLGQTTLRDPDSGSPPPLNAENDNQGADPRVEAPRILARRDVAALIINKMIGTGIFTGPYTVLVNTRSKRVAMALWVLGLAYTILSMIMYLEYARKLPFTGGELVYLDDVFSGQRLWAYTLYAFYFVFVYTTCTNAMQFANQTMLASNGKGTVGKDDNMDMRLVRFLAITATTAICLLLYLSESKSRWLNRATAAAKLLLLVVIVGFGGAYINKHGAHTNDWGYSPVDGSPPTYHADWVVAFITVLFSFHGWENATLVTGEIPSFSVLRSGFILGVSSVGILYLVVACLFCVAFPEQKTPKNYAAAYFSVSTKDSAGEFSDTAGVATAILIAISAIGSMISVAYTSVRVKQCIGWAGILPWSWFWRRSGPLRPKFSWHDVNENEQAVEYLLDQDPLTNRGTPEGGIVLHWIVTVVYICLTATQDKLQDAINFSGNLVVYGHFLIEGLVAVGFIWLDPVPVHTRLIGYPARNWLPADQRHPPPWMRQLRDRNVSSFQKLKHGILQTILGLVVLLFSFAVVIFDLFRRQGQIALGVTGGILVLASVYWAIFVQSDAIYEFLGFKLRKDVHGEDDHSDPSRRCHWCFDGSRHRHPHDSYEFFNEVEVCSTSRRTRFLHLIFGSGSHEEAFRRHLDSEQRRNGTPLQE
ncbi:amino acid permease-domain-containing protein [Ilyonectria robusta]|uniref:amino acid permease-domain-containing protein n=1 Tax=Ilyonectria robusta TaxID=1079257 RepID=UPI001E8CCAFE|nr:amino acid permease-domain-containing protein [Ilyonectria robusta]KAH8673161.1 amino acid permease-domain-containing protein [Ilyonectria robusta]